MGHRLTPIQHRLMPTFAIAALLVGAASVSLRGQWAPKVGEWATYGGDLASTRYSPLDQINAANFEKLQLAFRFKTDNFGPRPEFQFQSTPLMVNGRLFTTAGTRRAVVALDAANGEMLWMHSINEGKRGEAAPRQLSGRGLAYWSDGKDERVVYVTPGYQMIALDARTGQRVNGFGTGGIVDLKLGLDQEGLDLTTAEIGLHAAPIISKDIIVIGAAHREGGAPRSKTNVKGYVRGFDVRTGKRVWVFHTIPLKGEFGYDTWDPDAAAYTGNTGVWAQMSADEELGIVYMPVELPTGDYYGGHRGGNKKGSPDTSLFSETLLALDIKTGQRKWHYQLVHHGLWDHDIPCAPILMDLVVDGKPVKAVAQPTKQNWLYVFDRVTGKPVWPIEERPVEKGDVPGEWYSPTQPFVTKPPAYERQGVTVDDLIDFTPELRAEAIKIASMYKMGPIFTPPVVSKWEGPRGTLMIPEVTGGANWQGGSFDPETKRFYIFTNVAITSLSLTTPEKDASDMLYVRGIARNPDPTAKPAGPGGGGLNVRGLPLIKPPYATITAIDMNKGEQLWRIPHGETADNIKNNPALKGLTIPRTGRPGRIGVLTTKTLLIAGEGGFATYPEGRGAYLRAYDKATGADIGKIFMPAPQTGSPMTYLLNGTQYLAVAVSGAGYPGELLVYKLGN
ncbi:MAG TPA: PQQ-binding-like beta-propeller repeat protein [Vicinamibacterales bacterium]|nr:PQQ-binding-like beta-propeller repeat protein [Vicinamibacterales bacterium]